MSGRSRHREVIFFFPGCMLYKSDGCQTRALETLEFLVSENFPITVYSFSNHSKWPWTGEMAASFRKTYPNVALVCEPLSRAHRSWTSARNLLFRVVPFLPPRLAEMPLPLIAPEWRKIYGRRRDVLFWINYADGVTQLNGIGGGRVIVDTHDLLFLERSQRDGWNPRSAAGFRYLRKELALLAGATRILTISPREQEFFSIMLGGELQVSYLPPRLAVNPETRSHPYEADLLFLGSDNRKNIRFLNGFLEEFVHWTIKPSLVIAGKVSEHVKQPFRADLRITVCGYVPDLAALYSKVRAVVCPVDGTGVNMKIIEAINHCKPVFASEGARAALSPEVRARTFPLTELAVEQLLNDPERLIQARSSIGELREHSENNEIWNRLADCLRDM